MLAVPFSSLANLSASYLALSTSLLLGFLISVVFGFLAFSFVLPYAFARLLLRGRSRMSGTGGGVLFIILHLNAFGIGCKSWRSGP